MCQEFADEVEGDRRPRAEGRGTSAIMSARPCRRLAAPVSGGARPPSSSIRRGFLGNDRTLHAPGDGTHLVAREQVRDLEGDRGSRDRGAGRAGPDRGDARGSGADPGARRVRGRAHRRARGHPQPRRDRVPHQHGRAHRRRPRRGRPQAQPLGALRDDVERPGRHLALLPDDAGDRHPHRRRAATRRDLQAPRVRDPRHAVRRPHPRHPRRADDDGHEVRPLGVGVEARARPPRADSRGRGHGRDQRRRGHATATSTRSSRSTSAPSSA